MVFWVAVVILAVFVFHATALPVIKKNRFIDKYGTEVYATIGLVEEGEIIKFGKYEQDNDLENGKEDIEWIVLKVEGGKAFLISEYVLDYQPYHNRKGEVSWETSSLRAWLNEEFFNEAFSEKEKEIVLPSTPAGYLIQDHVFLWSFQEAPSPVLKQDELRKCQATAYAKGQGAYTTYMENVTWWWLIHTTSERVDQGPKQAFFIMHTGHESDSWVTASAGVRPVLWIDLKAVSLTK